MRGATSSDRVKAMQSQRQPVVLIHGIWMTGLELRLLGRRLAGCGFEPHYFHYRSLMYPPDVNAVRLRGFIRGVIGSPVHLVAHSLGGIVLLHLFDLFPDLPSGRVVLLGSPVNGSGVAMKVAGSQWLRPLLGKSLSHGLAGGVPCWPGGRDLGVIGGVRGRGVGRVLGGLQGDNDGTVALHETRLAGASDFCVQRVDHMGMVLSRPVAREVCAFLRQGRFAQGTGPISRAVN